jgi:hypothetical protein
MDIDLAVSACRAGDDVSFQIDRENVLHRYLVETDAMCFHEKPARIIRQAHRNMPAGKVLLAFSDQHFAGINQLLFDDSVRRLTMLCY